MRHVKRNRWGKNGSANSLGVRTARKETTSRVCFVTRDGLSEKGAIRSLRDFLYRTHVILIEVNWIGLNMVNDIYLHCRRTLLNSGKCKWASA